MEGKLNHLLANLVVEYHKLQNLHWYVEGPDFFQAHAKLEEYYGGINGAIDEVAEAILQLGGKPVASLREVLDLASIEERPDAHVRSAEALEIVRADYQALLDEVVSIKRDADERGAYLVSALMDGYVAEFSKAVWMISQSQR